MVAQRTHTADSAWESARRVQKYFEALARSSSQTGGRSMKILARTAVAAFLVLITFTPTQAQDISAAEATIVRYYQYYLRRNPGRAEVLGWLYHVSQTGASARQVEAGIIASPEYYRYCRNNPRIWVGMLFNDVLGRNATLPEYQLVLARLIDYQGDRSRTAEDFLAAARGW
jgi:hypothetical protein